jgi:hypothetical protein
MARVQILHNISRDASFGLNTVFRTGGEAPEGVRSIQLSDGRFTWKDMADTPDERHELAWVFQYEASYSGDQADPHELLNAAFETFNIGTDELAAQYRARRLRSLSVGDVVQIDGDAYTCASVGWEPVHRADLRILPAREAEARVRERFEFKATEPLAISVPLPD